MKKITKKEQARIDKEKRDKEASERYLKRVAHLKTLGLEKEVFITLSTLKEIFTEKNIKIHFPVPYDTAINPNLSQSYQRDNPEAMMKLYRFADVIEKVREGVKPRIKPSLNDKYKSILEFTTLQVELPINEVKRKVNKI